MREMKNSGVEWIGKIPKEWSIVKFKYLHNGLNTGEAIDKEYWESDAGLNAFYTAGLTPIRTGYSNFPTWKETRENDLLLARNGTPYVYLPVSKAYYTDHIIRAAMSSLVNRRFIRYCLQQSIASIAVDSVSIPTWSATLWNNQILTWPSVIEQERIAAFLDAECAEIDAVLEKTRASIEEYKKLKQAVITQVVTKGVRGDRPMKDSGSVWFEEIPCNWVMKRIKYLFHIKKDIAGKEGYTVLSITQRGIQPKDLSKNEGQIAANYSQYQLLAPGDFAMNHMDLLTGWVDISKYSGVTSPDYRVFVLDDAEKNDSSYYLYLMQMCYFNRIFYGLGQGVSGMGRWRLQADNFLNFPVVVPPVDEQKEIVSYLNEKCKQLDTLIRNKQQYLTEIENYKKSLIYEYVTGKKEVHPL